MANAHPTEILSLPAESFADALRRLDPASRALLDLSLRRGMRPEEIADILGADPDTVVSSRDHALEQVASDLGVESGEPLDELRARLAELPSEDWTGTARAEPSVEEPGPSAALGEVPAEEAEPSAAAGETPGEEAEPSNVVRLPARTPAADEPPAVAAPAVEPARRERRARPALLLLLALVLAGAIVGIVLAATSGGGGGSSSNKPAGQTPAKPAKPGQPAGVALVPVGPNGRGAKGTASVRGGRLHLDVTGLATPKGGVYEVWLYNSVIDAVPLGSSGAGHLVLNAKLPADASRYRFVDVSFEPADGNAAHSGDSVVRVSLKKLLR